MKAYLELCQRIFDEGTKREDRTGTGTISIFGHQMRFNLSDGFPLLTTKKLHVRSIIYKLYGSYEATPTYVIYKKMACVSGMNGLMKMAI